MHGVHRNLDDIRRRTLHGRVHRGAFAELAAVVIRAAQLRQRAAAPVHCDGISFRLALADARIHEPMNRRVAGKIARDKLGGFLAGDVAG